MYDCRLLTYAYHTSALAGLWKEEKIYVEFHPRHELGISGGMEGEGVRSEVGRVLCTTV